MDGKVTLHRLTLQMSGLLSLAGFGLLSQEAQASAEIPTLDPDPGLGEALAPAPHAVDAPEPSAQPTAPEVDNLDPQPAWAPIPDETAMMAAPIASSEPVEIAPPIAAALPVTAPGKVPLAAVETDLTGDFGAVDPEAIEIELEPAAEPSYAQSTDVGAGSPALTSVAEFPPAVDGGHGSELTSAIAPAAAPATLPVAAPPFAQPSQATIVPPPPVAPSAEPELAGAPTTTAIYLPPAGLPISAEETGTPTAAPRPDAPDMATLRARAETITALLQDIRSTAGLDATLPSGSATASAPHRQVTPPETRSLGPQLPPIPSQSVAPRRPLGAGLEVTDKPVKDGLTPAQGRREPQLPILPRSAAQPNVALALAAPQPAMTPSRPALADLAQAEPGSTRPAPIDLDSLRDDLRIAPLTTTASPARTYAPAPNAGIPSAFGANWGDAFISASLAGADRLRPEADGSLSMGFGLGDSRQAVGVELAYNLLSIRDFAANGSFDVKVHREVYASDQTQVAAAVGLSNALRYGSDTATTESSLYGVVTTAHLLQPDHGFNRLPITVSLGLGGGNFAADNTDVGVIGGVGLQVHPQFSVNTAWSGVGLNVGASIVPVSRVPLSLNLLYGDIGNNTRAGSVAVISIGYGYSSAPRF